MRPLLVLPLPGSAPAGGKFKLPPEVGSVEEALPRQEGAQEERRGGRLRRRVTVPRGGRGRHRRARQAGCGWGGIRGIVLAGGGQFAELQRKYCIKEG